MSFGLRTMLPALLAFGCVMVSFAASENEATQQVLDFEEVTATIEAIESLDEKAEAWGQAGMLYHARHLSYIALQAYTNALAIKEDPRWFYLRGIAYREQGELGKATANFRQVTVLDPDYMPAWYRLGAGLLVRGDIEKAADALQTADELAPNSALVLMGQADVAKEQGQLEEARSILLRAIKIAPDAGQLAYKLAMVHRRLGDVAEARRWLAIRGDRNTIPEIDDPWLLLVARLSQSGRFYARAGEWALERGDLLRAEQAYEQAVELDPDNEQASVAYSYVLGEAGRLGAALGEADRYLQRHPESPGVLYGKAWLLRLDIDTLDEAIESVTSALRWRDDDKYRALLAGLYLKSGRLAEATEQYSLLITKQPEQAYFRYWHGISQIAQGRCTAKRSVQTAIRQRATWGEAHRLLARNDAICGYGEAAFDRAIALQKARDSVDARITLAFSELGLGRTEAAHARARELLPHPDAQLLISAIDSGNLPMPYAPGSTAWLPAEVLSNDSHTLRSDGTEDRN